MCFNDLFGLKFVLRAYPKNNRSGATITVRLRHSTFGRWNSIGILVCTDNSHPKGLSGIYISHYITITSKYNNNTG